MTHRRNEHLPATQFDNFPHTLSLHSQVPIATSRRRRRVFHLTTKKNLFRDRSPLRKRRERDSALTSTTASAWMTGRNGHGWLPATTTTKYTRIKPIEERGFDRDVDVELSCRRSQGRRHPIIHILVGAAGCRCCILAKEENGDSAGCNDRTTTPPPPPQLTHDVDAAIAAQKNCCDFILRDGSGSSRAETGRRVILETTWSMHGDMMLWEQCNAAC